MKKYLFVFAASMTLLACSPKIAETVTEDTVAMPADANAGKMIFSNKCNKCHDLPKIDSYSREKWDKVLPPMSEKAKLTGEERQKVEAYVTWELAN